MLETIQIDLFSQILFSDIKSEHLPFQDQVEVGQNTKRVPKSIIEVQKMVVLQNMKRRLNKGRKESLIGTLKIDGNKELLMIFQKTMTSKLRCSVTLLVCHRTLLVVSLLNSILSMKFISLWKICLQRGLMNITFRLL